MFDLECKETPQGAKMGHEKTTKIVTEFDKFLDPFALGYAKYMKSGTVIDDKIIDGFIKSAEAGENA